ncbi:sulfatase [Chloroflexi bacterium TSY]|nr:sulfatase [Chloroflexi bacterium TSY]
MRILYIDIDSLRPDHLSCYGYHRKTSPNIDALAAEGVRFSNFYATDTPCLPSRTALFSGRFGTCTGVINHGGVYADMPLQGSERGFRSEQSWNSLGSVMRRAGYHAASISPFPRRHSAYQVWNGFTETYDTGGGGLENADEMYPPIQRWLQANGSNENWFLHVNFWDPHTPYDHPEGHGNPFANEPIGDWITQEMIDQQNASFGPHSATEVAGYSDQLPDRWTMGVGHIKTLDDAKAHLDGYDTGIHYADYYVGKLVQALKDLGIYEETAILISADHGENQGELNVWGDHQTADHICNRVPLVVRWPSVTDEQAGHERTGFHYNIDLAVTLVEMIDGQIPPTWNGRSFASALSGPEVPGLTCWDYLVLSQGAWSCQRSARWDKYILIRTYHTGLKEFPAYMLFDLEIDPHETTNLAAKHPDLLGHGLRLLDEWMAERMNDGLRGDPFWGVIAEGGPLHANERGQQWAGYLERLRSTGRSHHAERLTRFGGRPLTSGLE